MKRLLLYTTILLTMFSMVSMEASAHDFEVNGIFYKITSSTEKTVDVTYMGNDYTSKAYSGSVVIPESITYGGVTYSVTTIGKNAFRYCSGLTSIIIPNSVTCIGESAFSGCSGLTSIIIPNSVTRIGGYAFNGCSGLISITIPNSVTSIVDGVFYGCSGLTSIDIPNSVTTIGINAFRYCSGLTSIDIPNSVTSIGESAFSGCSVLTTITMGSGVRTIGALAFGGCNLNKVIIPDIAAWCNINFASTNSIPFSDSTKIYSDKDKEVIDLRIPEGVTTVNNYAFAGCRSIISIDIPNSVTTIGGCAFMWCSSLKSATLGNGVQTIGDYAFSLCSGMTTINIPNSVTSIGNYAFSNCSSLTSIMMPNSITSIGGYAFQGCRSLISINIPNAINKIENGTFVGCNFTSIEIPDSVITIGDEMAVNDYIGKGPFSDCYSLTSIIIPNSVTSIGDKTFYGCSNLESISIGNSVTTIGKEAFRGCKSLNSIEIPNSVTAIGGDAFRDTKWLEDQPEGLIYAGKVAYAYKGPMERKTNIVLDDGTLGIAGNAFYWYDNLVSIVIPNSVSSIGSHAFEHCSLLIIKSETENPFDINENVFSQYTYNEGLLFVPKGTKEKYESCEGWKNFLRIMDEDIDSVNKNCLRVKSLTGDAVAYFPLKDEPRILFSEGTMTFTSAEETLTFNQEEIQFDYCVDPRTTDGISLPEEVKKNLKFGNAVLSGLNAGETVRVYAQDGKVMAACKADNSGMVRLDMNSLPQGLYIVQAGTFSFKFMNSKK